jgi:hypothetical protein
MRCARVLFSYTVSDDVFRMTGFESAGFDRFAISLFTSKPDERKKQMNQSQPLVCRCGNRGGDFQALALVARHHMQASSLKPFRLKAEADIFPPWPAPPMPCEPAYWPGQPPPRSDGHAMSVVRATH